MSGLNQGLLFYSLSCFISIIIIFYPAKSLILYVPIFLCYVNMPLLCLSYSLPCCKPSFSVCYQFSLLCPNHSSSMSFLFFILVQTLLLYLSPLLFAMLWTLLLYVSVILYPVWNTLLSLHPPPILFCIFFIPPPTPSFYCSLFIQFVRVCCPHRNPTVNTLLFPPWGLVSFMDFRLFSFLLASKPSAHSI